MSVLCFGIAGPLEPATVPYLCDFEDDTLCGMIQNQEDNLDWSWGRRSTPTDSTGPDDAFNGEGYAYLEATNGGFNDFARYDPA